MLFWLFETSTDCQKNPCTSHFFKALYVLLQCNYNCEEAMKKFKAQPPPEGTVVCIK